MSEWKDIGWVSYNRSTANHTHANFHIVLHSVTGMEPLKNPSHLKCLLALNTDLFQLQLNLEKWLAYFYCFCFVSNSCKVQTLVVIHFIHDSSKVCSNSIWILCCAWRISTMFITGVSPELSSCVQIAFFFLLLLSSLSFPLTALSGFPFTSHSCRVSTTAHADSEPLASHFSDASSCFRELVELED